MQHQYLVLGVGYSQYEYAEEAQAWARLGIGMDFADNVEQAVQKLSCADYICVVIRAENITANELCALRQTKPIPILVLPLSYSAVQRYAYAQKGIMQYLHAAKPGLQIHPQDSLQRYLHIPAPKIQGLTVISIKDMTFCLEQRSVEVRGQKIDLTVKEFDILALLIMNPKRVFTYEILMEMVWQEEPEYYSRKTIQSHASNMRRKLKIAPNVPDYIKCVQGIGYKFDVT